MKQPQTVAVLMYHATYGETTPLSTIDPVDRPYAVSEQAFCQHIASMRQSGYAFVAESDVSTFSADTSAVLLTFDDGHNSNARFVSPILAEMSTTALFFVTADWIGEREHYCSPSELRAMSDRGMAIGSHGCSHDFFPDMNSERARAELRDSKLKLEDIVGRAVDSISFPGGRCGERDIEMAHELGYRWLHGSVFGVHRVGVTGLISRLPVRQGMNDNNVLAMCDPTSTQHRLMRLSSAVKSTAKRVLGNRAYDAIYKRFAT